MRILAIETSGNMGSVALADNETIVREISFEKGMIHGRELIPSIQSLLVNCDMRLSDIDLIAVDIGPGSYTGLRVGLATAKGLAYAAGKEIVGVSSLDILAENAENSGAENICPIVDAKWKQVYFASYNVREGKRVRAGDYRADLPERAAEILRNGTLIFGDGVERYREIFARTNAVEGEAAMAIPKASKCALLGLESFRGGTRHSPFDLVPLYLRPTEAEYKIRNAQ